MKRNINKVIVAATLYFISFTPVWANNFTVSPLIIDVEAEQRDSFVKNITIKNDHHAHQRFYVSVHEISVDEDGVLKEFIPASMSDRSVAVTSWLEISRARMDLQSGESKELPLTVRVNHSAPAGTYHAYIGFAEGSNIDEASEKVVAGLGEGVLVRINIEAEVNETLKLSKFTTDKFSIFKDEGRISYTLENTGDVPLVPTGDVIIYDVRGQELTSVPINTGAESVALSPGESREFTQDLPYFGRLGRHKAFLNVEYGELNKASVYDTNFYYSIPWYYLFVIAILFLILIISLTLLSKRRSQVDYALSVPEDGDEVPLRVGVRREHVDYEHDINLKDTKK